MPSVVFDGANQNTGWFHISPGLFWLSVQEIGGTNLGNVLTVSRIPYFAVPMGSTITPSIESVYETKVVEFVNATPPTKIEEPDNFGAYYKLGINSGGYVSNSIRVNYGE